MLRVAKALAGIAVADPAILYAGQGPLIVGDSPGGHGKGSLHAAVEDRQNHENRKRGQ